MNRYPRTRATLAGLAALWVVLIVIVVALNARAEREQDQAPSSAGVVAAAPVAYRGPAVVRHKARQCYTIRDDAGRVLYRKCSVRWVQDVRHRSTLEQFRARYGGAA